MIPETHVEDGLRPFRRLWRRLVEHALGVPLFLKILVANAVIAALAGGAALVVVYVFAPGEIRSSVLVVASLFALAILFLGGALNALVIRLALSPLSLLARTAERVRQGEFRARVPSSRLADRATERVVSVFNSMLDSVQSAHDRQQELALRVLQAEERERGRIAHELYSGTAQTLAGVLVRLRLAARAEDGECPTVRSLPEEIRGEVAAALDEIRGVARRLRPPELDELGVRAALAAHARTLGEGRPIQVEVQGQVPEDRLTRDGALALFRIAQEAVTNAVLHSGGNRVVVTFSGQERGLLVEIADDGRGFDVRDLFSGREPYLGVTGMRERAVYVGGTLSIDSAPDGGTRVRVLIPWATENAPGTPFEEDATTSLQAEAVPPRSMAPDALPSTDLPRTARVVR